VLDLLLYNMSPPCYHSLHTSRRLETQPYKYVGAMCRLLIREVRNKNKNDLFKTDL